MDFLYLLAQDCDIQVMSGTASSLQNLDEGQVFNGLALACPIENLGDVSFCRDYAIRYPYVGGAMAKGISSVAMVVRSKHSKKHSS